MQQNALKKREKRAPKNLKILRCMNESANWEHYFFTSLTGDGTAILSDYPSHVKVWPFAGERQYLHF